MNLYNFLYIFNCMDAFLQPLVFIRQSSGLIYNVFINIQ